MANTEDKIKAEWSKTEPELRDLAKSTIERAAEIAKVYLETGAYPSETGTTLDDAILRAWILDEKLLKNIERVRAVQAMAGKIFDTALQIALRFALAAI